MNSSGINSYSAYDAASYSATSSANAKTSHVKDDAEKSNKSAYSDTAATYESSKSTASGTVNHSQVAAQIKSANQARIEQMQSLVTKMFQQQGIAIGKGDDMWKMLASGNFTADADTIAQAKADIAEDGYWGVNQTSDRIFSFALALSGGDSEKMEQMVKAVEKGFSQATGAWGGKMPSITDDTHSAIMDKFDQWFKDNGSTATTEQLLKS